MIRQLDPEKREKYLQAALKLFVEKGVDRTSTAEISNEAGTAAGTLFNYFPTKQDLIDELVLDITQQQSQNINSRLDENLSARESFWNIWKATIDWFMAHPDAYRYVRLIRDSGLLGPEILEETGKQFRFYYDAIQKGYAEDSIKPYPVDLVGGIFYYFIIAVMDILLAQVDADTREETVQDGFAIFWDGICK